MTVSARHERDAARAARNDRAEEVAYLLALLTKTPEWLEKAHVAPAKYAGAGLMNFVVCVHVGDERMAWRVSDFEVYAYFKHLPHKPCVPGLNRNEKMARLAGLASK